MVDTSSKIVAANIPDEEQVRFRQFTAEHPHLGLSRVEFHKSLAHSLGGLSCVAPGPRPEVSLLVLGVNYDRATGQVISTVPASFENQLNVFKTFYPNAELLVVSNVPVWARESHGDQLADSGLFTNIVAYAWIARLMVTMAAAR